MTEEPEGCSTTTRVYDTYIVKVEGPMQVRIGVNVKSSARLKGGTRRPLHLRAVQQKVFGMEPGDGNGKGYHKVKGHVGGEPQGFHLDAKVERGGMLQFHLIGAREATRGLGRGDFTGKKSGHFGEAGRATTGWFRRRRHGDSLVGTYPGCLLLAS